MRMEDLLKYLPQRPPFLFVDRVVEHYGNCIVAEKDLQARESYFEGHFPGNPVMPGVLICEFVFQTGTILMAILEGGFEGRLPVLTRIKNVHIKNPAFPGDTLSAQVTLKQKLANAYFLEGRVVSGSKKIMTLDFAGMLTRRDK